MSLNGTNMLGVEVLGVVDKALSADSENPVQNKVIFESITIPNTATKKANKDSLEITDGINASYPLDVIVEQTVKKYEVGVNKDSEKTISNDYMQNARHFITVPANNAAVFSFDIVGSGTITAELQFALDEYGGPTFYETAIINNENGRYYINIYNADYDLGAISFQVTDDETYLDNVALRFDNSIEYVPWERKEILVDLTEITVTEEITGQQAQVNADGAVNGLYATGENMKFTINPHNNVCALTVIYKRDIKTALEATVGQINTVLAALTEVE